MPSSRGPRAAEDTPDADELPPRWRPAVQRGDAQRVPHARSPPAATGAPLLRNPRWGGQGGGRRKKPHLTAACTGGPALENSGAHAMPCPRRPKEVKPPSGGKGKGCTRAQRLEKCGGAMGLSPSPGALQDRAQQRRRASGRRGAAQTVALAAARCVPRLGLVAATVVVAAGAGVFARFDVDRPRRRGEAHSACADGGHWWPGAAFGRGSGLWVLAAWAGNGAGGSCALTTGEAALAGCPVVWWPALAWR
jgi:hypothetical protein